MTATSSFRTATKTSNLTAARQGGHPFSSAGSVNQRSEFVFGAMYPVSSPSLLSCSCCNCRRYGCLCLAFARRLAVCRTEVKEPRRSFLRIRPEFSLVSQAGHLGAIVRLMLITDHATTFHLVSSVPTPCRSWSHRYISLNHGQKTRCWNRHWSPSPVVRMVRKPCGVGGQP